MPIVEPTASQWIDKIFASQRFFFPLGLIIIILVDNATALELEHQHGY